MFFQINSLIFLLNKKRLMFAISGMKLFRNKFGYCGSPDTFFVNQEQVEKYNNIKPIS